MVETVHLNRQRKNYRRQLEHDRAVQAAAIRGEQPPAWSKHDERDEDDSVGDNFSVQGDTTNHHHYPPPTPAATPTAPQTASTLVKAALVAAGLLGGGSLAAVVPWLLGAYDKTTTTTVNTSQDLGMEVEVIPGGALEP